MPGRHTKTGKHSLPVFGWRESGLLLGFAGFLGFHIQVPEVSSCA